MDKTVANGMLQKTSEFTQIPEVFSFRIPQSKFGQFVRVIKSLSACLAN